MGHCSKFCYALWATMANLVVRYWLLLRIWLHSMGHCDTFGYALWATARNEAVQYKSVMISALWAIRVANSTVLVLNLNKSTHSKKN
jgi:hypothetical protein